jgi:DnaJ-class molecular chaperone
MSKDYYQTLGIAKTATKEEIKKAFRKLAQKYHPDKPTGDEAKFKEINEAYSTLSDDKKRSQYDNFGSSFNGSGGGSGFEGFSSQGFDFSGFSQGFKGANGAQYEFDLGDIFGSMFGSGYSRVRRGQDIVMDTKISFHDSIKGISKTIGVQRNDGSREDIKVNIPAGIDSGEMIRYREKGEKIQDGIPGDLYIRINVEKHKTLRKEGYHLVSELTIKITESILGSTKTIETIDGDLSIKIPKGIQHGEVLRVKGKGVAVGDGRAGDLLIHVSIKMPTNISSKAKKALETLRDEGL